jgi:hypothetical protein
MHRQLNILLASRLLVDKNLDRIMSQRSSLWLSWCISMMCRCPTSHFRHPQTQMLCKQPPAASYGYLHCSLQYSSHQQQERRWDPDP